MFSIFKKKPADVSSVHPSVGTALTRATQFPGNVPAPPLLAATCRKVALSGIPPQASVVADAVPGQTTTAFIVEQAGAAPLAIANVNNPTGRVEIWELEAATLRFVRQKARRMDPEQDSWVTWLLSDVACLPGKRVLVGLAYYAPQVKQALFIYDVAADAFTRFANVVPDIDDRRQFFATLNVASNVTSRAAAEASLVLYNTNQVRTGPEKYYNSFNHLVLFTAKHPDGLEILKLAAADGSIRRWAVIDRTLWLQTTDRRDPRQPADFVWSLDLSNVL